MEEDVSINSDPIDFGLKNGYKKENINVFSFIDDNNSKDNIINTSNDSKDIEYKSYRNGKFLFPGFIDTHIHASQYPNNGIFGKSTLLDWLETYTFPLESSISLPKNKLKCENIYRKVIERTLQNGTTMASYFTTINSESTKIFADLIKKLGQKALIGNVCMNQNSPSYYIQKNDEESINETQNLIDYCSKIDPSKDLITPIITPRFAPSCTESLLKKLGNISKKTNLPIQTHVSENRDEIAWVKNLFPNYDSYTDIYYKNNLLNDKTILAHAIYLSEDEKNLIQKQKSSISHCPISNSSITSGEARIRWLLDNDINVSLGSDCSGGFEVSLLVVARHALLVSRHVSMKSNNDKDKLSIEEVLYLATLGGAKACNVVDKVGNFKVGKKFDAQLIDVLSPGSKIDLFDFQINDKNIDDDIYFDTIVAKWLFNGDDRNTRKVWVNGIQVVDK